MKLSFSIAQLRNPISKGAVIKYLLYGGGRYLNGP